jgi:hypothetical protein
VDIARPLGGVSSARKSPATAAVKKSFDAMVEAEATFKADLEKLLKAEGHMPEDKFLVMSRKGKRIGLAFASTPRGEGGAGSLKFKTK